MKKDSNIVTSEIVHYRDVVVTGSESIPVAYPHRVGIETRCRAEYGQKGRTRTLDDPCCIFQYTLRGEGWFTDDRGGHLLPPGTGFLCESHDPRIAYRYPEDGKSPWEFVYMSFGGEGVTRIVRDFGERETRVLTMNAVLPALTELIRYAGGEGATLYLESHQATRLVMGLLTEALSSRPERPVNANERRVKEVQEKIDYLLALGRVDLRELAESVGLSREGLCRFYRDHTGESPYAYIRKKQMLLACRWLLEGSFSVKEIALRLGFSSPSNFIRSFKQVVGLTPTELIDHGVLPRI